MFQYGFKDAECAEIKLIGGGLAFHPADCWRALPVDKGPREAIVLSVSSRLVKWPFFSLRHRRDADDMGYGQMCSMLWAYGHIFGWGSRITRVHSIVAEFVPVKLSSIPSWRLVPIVDYGTKRASHHHSL